MNRIRTQCALCDKKFIRRCSQTFTFESKELANAYQPDEVEKSANGDYFVPKIKSNERPFSLVLPPPNITGTLHLGHALTATIQDVLIRWQKMRGRETVWVPGLDHAGIATQVVVEKRLWKEKGLRRQDIGRERFAEEVWKWKKQKSSTIREQLRRLNVALDWDREVFTMDEARSATVTRAFVKLFDLGLIYRADRLVNWSCVLQSTISDIEVDHVALDGATDLTVPGYDRPVRFGVLANFAYTVVGSREEIVVATTRPETMLGDVAVAVHPNDSRYSHLVGKRLRHPFRDDVIPVVADDFVDPDFGTGAVKLTPAHDPADFEAAKRHDLPAPQIINEEGRLTSFCGDLEGAKRFDARRTVLDRLADLRLLRSIADHQTVVPRCSRSGDVVEFLVRAQWFLACANMAETALNCVEDFRLSLEPRHFEKQWSDWLRDTRDWCISRQLWWGHRVPAYSCSGGGGRAWVAAESATEARRKARAVLDCAEDDVVAAQDEDVLDTWFSSALQPFSVFDQKGDLERYYPLSMMETGHDILFFWVARMVMLCTQITGVLPFREAILHGIVCDARGRKMSKSLGNVVAPDDVIRGATLPDLEKSIADSYEAGLFTEEEFVRAIKTQREAFSAGIPQCGADALRFTLLTHNVKSHFVGFDVSECHANRLFCNKIWQATKFTLFWCRQVEDRAALRDLAEASLMDRWILSRLSAMVRAVHAAFESRDFYVATTAIKQFLYYEFCDIYLECAKTPLRDAGNVEVAKRACLTLLQCLDVALRCLAPFMPSLSQHLHERLPRRWNVGQDRGFPQELDWDDETLEKDVERARDVVVALRRLKKTFNVSAKHDAQAVVVTTDAALPLFAPTMRDLTGLRGLAVATAPPHDVADYIEDSASGTRVFLKVPPELREALRADVLRLRKTRGKLAKELVKMDKMMSGDGYAAKASADARKAHSEKVAALREKINRINYIERLSREK
ncbi:valine--tRNA ligase-like [Cylas formicarius]|uniref:valine--tRNA ligase-like n=1 Tax=Cylas formicarius TaxID=197179 RepID=UPI0029585E0D|nr:valine--tRNA ligase-like [Cylas formicarius]